ncbi:MAG: GTPase HflX [Candidatus Bathyarchaeota archaeon]|nr:GTPase HflX [Candidatus Bathyarchaeota archaeon]MDH5746695.1 GTPase HflX [Candidatus Bathyarchaeota archaeon]
MVQRRRSREPSTLEELKSLAETAGYAVIGKIEQVREPDSRYQIGAGKVEELAQLVKETDTQKTIFDNPLKPVQAYNLAKATGVEAIDRFQLILEIFARRATTKEAKLQIQLARLRYELTHAKEKVRLARMEEQPGFMGLGAYEVDVYYETVKRQIQTIREKLRKIRKKRVLHRQRRTELGFSSISLAGYTNAGKSSLFNALTEEEVPVDDALFTTLSTKTRLVEFSKKKFLLTDTVGFIDRLPLTLIEAFHSTLEETIYSDLILLVVDVSEPISTIEKKLSCCLETIERIGASGIPIITALNKIDLLTEKEIQQRLESLRQRAPNPVSMSALYKINFDLVKQKILKMLKNYVQASFSIPLTSESMSFISWLFNRADVHTTKYNGDFAHVIFEAIPWFAEKVKKRVEEEFNGKFMKAQIMKA